MGFRWKNDQNSIFVDHTLSESDWVTFARLFFQPSWLLDWMGSRYYSDAYGNQKLANWIEKARYCAYFRLEFCFQILLCWASTTSLSASVSVWQSKTFDKTVRQNRNSVISKIHNNSHLIFQSHLSVLRMFGATRSSACAAYCFA